MSNFQSFAGFSAGVVSIICVLPYIISTIQGKTKPHRVTWWVLSTIGFVLSANQYLAGGGNTIWMPLCAAIGQLGLALLSIRYGEGGWSTLDRICIVGACVSIAAWKIFHSPLLALGLSIMADFLGCLPTMQKSRRAPETENLTSWSLYLVGSVLNLFAVDQWNSVQMVLPSYIFMTDIIVVSLLLAPHLRILQAKSRMRRGVERYLPTVISMQLLALREFYNLMWHHIHTSELYFRLHFIFVEERYNFDRFATDGSTHRRYYSYAPTPLQNQTRRDRARRNAIQPESNHSLEWL
ncbi:hypothetical protein IQ266_21215 [filamentous cyanobacterium LEGE 11480]|uniref:Uncharacterized protein n=1 Tax=Romeriopsis navalis LEGE 11480 TaxID=2777977 RepID=A0A928VP90_9CYAN|nr:hypothetical protein [Romeriopsis navalis]MBE9032263.1 hypothetical protein [Romeriopsis navalis LEGE 11480]